MDEESFKHFFLVQSVGVEKQSLTVTQEEKIL